MAAVALPTVMIVVARRSQRMKSIELMQAAQAAGKWLIEKFIIHGLVAAVALPMTMMSISSLIDSQWTVVSLFKLSCILAACMSVSIMMPI